MGSSPRILIVKCAALGDVVRTTALLAPLQSRHTGAEIHWLSSPEGASFLRGIPEIHRVHELGAVNSEIFTYDYDLVVSMEEDPAAAAVAAQARSQKLLGVFPNGPGSLAFTEDSAPYFKMSLLGGSGPDGLKAANALKAANRKTFSELWCAILGLSPDPKLARPKLPPFMISAHDGSPRIGINAGAGARWPSKRLSLEKTVKLASAVKSRWNAAPLILGGKDEQELLKAFGRVPGCARIRETGHSILDFISIISSLDALITTDSLALHIADAAGIPAVALFGPTTPHEIAHPLCVKIPVQGHDDCFYRPNCTVNRNGLCLESLEIEPIMSALETLLPSTRIS